MKAITICNPTTMGRYFFSFIWVMIAFMSYANDNKLPNLKSDYLLVINAYTSDAPWSNEIIEPVQKWISTERNIAVFTEHLNMLIIENFEELNTVVTTVLEKYSNTRPKGILLLGNPALLLKDKIRKHWGDIPIILCAEEDYFGSDTAYIQKRPIP